MFQVLIYVGAITVLILYGVMFTPQSPRPYGLFFQTQKLWAALFVVPIAVFVALVAFQFVGPPRYQPIGVAGVIDQKPRFQVTNIRPEHWMEQQSDRAGAGVTFEMRAVRR